MPKITVVRERRGRVRVEVDGEFWAEIDSGVALERGIVEGAEYPAEELGVVRIEGEKPLALGRAFDLIGYRTRSEGEVRERLGRCGYAPETVEAVVGRLLEAGYLDDEEFARTFARQKARKYGPRRIALELYRAGVGRETSEDAVGEQFPGEVEQETARRAAFERYNTQERSDAQARRVYGFLARRGYSAEVCAEVAREYRSA